MRHFKIKKWRFQFEFFNFEIFLDNCLNTIPRATSTIILVVFRKAEAEWGERAPNLQPVSTLSFSGNVMLKSCPSCSYIGNDGEHVCPFCKANLAVGRPRRFGRTACSAKSMSYIKFTFLSLILTLATGFGLTSCSVNSNGPAVGGAAHGLLGSDNMSDYYYKRDAGWTYIFSNVERIYNTNGSVAQTLTGAYDTVRTLGFDGLAPNGDSLFRIEISYRVLQTWSNRPVMDILYLPSTTSNSSHGAFVDPSSSVPTGTLSMYKKPRPVSTDTILAGLVGRIRTTADDFSNSSNNTYAWQKDTVWVTSRLDTVFVWEYIAGNPNKVQSRCLFLRDFQNNDSWAYDVINGSSYGTTYFVDDKDASVTTAAGTFQHCVNIRVKTTEIESKDFNRENKYYACGYGPVYQYDWWYVTTDGNSFNKQDYTRSLISISHN
jgi:hypothetical protein